MQMLIQSFKINEAESFVFVDRPPKGDAILIALKARCGTCIKVVRRVQSVVTKEFVDRSMYLVRAASGNDDNLCAGSLSILCPIVIAKNIELLYRVHAQELPAGSTGLHVVLCGSGKLNTV